MFHELTRFFHVAFFQRERVPVPESDGGNLSDMPSHSEAIQGNTRAGLHFSGEVLETEEVEQMTLPKKTSKRAKATHLHAVSVAVCNCTFECTFHAKWVQKVGERRASLTQGLGQVDCLSWHILRTH